MNNYERNKCRWGEEMKYDIIASTTAFTKIKLKFFRIYGTNSNKLSMNYTYSYTV